MKITLKEIKNIINEAVKESKKKKKEVDNVDKNLRSGMTYSEPLDFSEPLGARNLYAHQGASAWGPVTTKGTTIDDKIKNTHGTGDGLAIDQFDGDLDEQFIPKNSSWSFLLKEKKNIWEEAYQRYVHLKKGLGRKIK